VLNVKISLTVATIVASIMLVVPFVAQAQQAGGGTAVAVIDINYIFKNHERFKAAMEDIKTDIEGFEAHLRDERNKITAKAEQLKTIPAGSAEYKQLEEEVASLHTQLQLETGRKRKDILDREARVYFNAYQEIVQRVAMFANRYGIGLVLRFSSEEMDPTKRESVLAAVNRAVVFQQNLNITNDILQELNRQTPPPNRTTTQPQIPGRQPLNR
jgi:Skp family chaperone for outer membrane proteins